MSAHVRAWGYWSVCADWTRHPVSRLAWVAQIRTAPGSAEKSLRECHRAGWSRLAVVVGPLELGRGHVPDGVEQGARLIPRDSLERRELDVLDASPGPTNGGSLQSCTAR